MKLYIVQSNGGEWSDDDFVSAAPAGVYSTAELANQALVKMMLDELQEVDRLDGYEDVDLTTLSFDELEEMWSEHMETEPFSIFERELDSVLHGVRSANERK